MMELTRVVIITTTTVMMMMMTVKVTRSQEVMEGGKESQKSRCHSQQGIHRCGFSTGYVIVVVVLWSTRVSKSYRGLCM